METKKRHIDAVKREMMGIVRKSRNAEYKKRLEYKYPFATEHFIRGKRQVD